MRKVGTDWQIANMSKMLDSKMCQMAGKRLQTLNENLNCLNVDRPSTKNAFAALRISEAWSTSLSVFKSQADEIDVARFPPPLMVFKRRHEAQHDLSRLIVTTSRAVIELEHTHTHTQTRKQVYL